MFERLTGIGASWAWALIGAASGQFLLSVSLAVCQVKGKAFVFAGLQIANSAFNLGLTLLIVVALSRGWEGRAIAQCAATLTIGLVGLFVVNRGQAPPLRTDRATVAQTLKFGGPLVPHALAAALMGSIDRLILLSIIDAAAAGRYFAAFQVASVISLTSSAINQAMAPWLFRNLSAPTDATPVRIVRVSYMVLGLLILQGVGLAALAEPVIRLAGGAAFVEAVPLLRILAIAMTLNGAYYLFTNYIFYVHRTHLLSMVTVTVAMVQVLTTVALVHLIGVSGAAWAAVVVNLLFVAGVWAIAARVVPMPWFDLKRLAQ